MPTKFNKLDRLQRVIDTQAAIVQADLDLDAFMQVIVDTVQELTGAKGAVVELVEGEHMVYRCASANFAKHVGLRLMREGSLSGLSVSAATVLRCDDAETDSRVDKEACRRVGVRSMICTPLFQAGTPVGVLKVMADQASGFDDADVQILNLLAGMLGAALGKQLAFDGLQRAEGRMRVILENANDAIISINQEQVIQRWNRAAERLFGWCAEEVMGTTLNRLHIPGEKAFCLADIFPQHVGETILPKLNLRQETSVIGRDGREITLEFTLSHNQFADAIELTAFIHDVSERKLMEKAMHDMALTDGLTGLANRRKVMDELTQAIARGRRLKSGMALLFMDLNGFKKINDQYGHDMGDQALLEFGRRLCTCIRETDLVGRLGGDEFVVLAEGVNSEEHAYALAEKIILSLKPPMADSGIALATSIGICLHRPAMNAHQWLNEADQAMYHAKHRGGEHSRIAMTTQRQDGLQ